MAPSTNRVVYIKTQEGSAKASLTADDMKLNLSNFLVGGDLVVSKSKKWGPYNNQEESLKEVLIVVSDRATDVTESSNTSNSAAGGSGMEVDDNFEAEEKVKSKSAAGADGFGNGQSAKNGVDAKAATEDENVDPKMPDCHGHGKTVDGKAGCEKKNCLSSKDKKASPSCMKRKRSNNKPGNGVCLKNKGKHARSERAEDTDTGYEAEASDAAHQQPPVKKNKHSKNTRARKMANPDSGASDATAETSFGDEDASILEITDDAATTTSGGEEAAAQTTTEEGTGDVSQMTDETAKTGEEFQEAKNTDRSSRPAGGDWTASEDAIVMSMKDGGETWASIGSAIGRGKWEVQRRWKELQAASSAEDVGSTTAEVNCGAGTTDNDADNEMAEAVAKMMKSSNHKNSLSKKDYDKPGDKADKKKEKKEKDKGKSKGKAPAEPSSGNEASAEPSSSAGECRWPPSEGELEAQREYIYSHVFGPLYGNEAAGGLSPDGSLSARDCYVLRVLDSKHKVERWLRLQAAFFNATGRMVPVELLQAKLEQTRIAD
jgi:hypothetical protein